MGTYIHGLFSDDAFRRHFLKGLGAEGSSLAFEAAVDETLDKLSHHLAQSLDVDRLLSIAEPVTL
jgi:adenosylcobyric acid synthase